MIINDAVNIALRYLGEMPVPDGVDIDSLDPLHEAYISREILIQKSKELQSQGWWFNRETWDFTPDTSNRIGVPPSVLTFDTTDDDVIKRGGSLYDRENRTYEFTSSVEGDVVWYWEFADLPEVMANYITYTAAQQVQLFFTADDFTDSKLDTEIQRAFIRVQREDMRNNNYNLVTGNRLIGRDSLPTAIS